MIVLVSIPALLIALSACQGEPTAAGIGDTPAPATMSAAPPSVPSATALPAAPGPSPTPVTTGEAATEPEMAATRTTPDRGSRNSPAVPARNIETATPSFITPATEAPVPTSTPDRVAEVAGIRLLVEAYWGAWNEYDVDRALAMLEEEYRALEEELIRKDLGRLKLFRVKLDVSEHTPPTRNAAGEYETYLTLGTPIDSRTVLMIFRRIDGQWWIVYSDEVE